MPYVLGNSFFKLLGQISRRTLVDTARVTTSSAIVFAGYHFYAKITSVDLLKKQIIINLEDKPRSPQMTEPPQEVTDDDRHKLPASLI